MKFISDTAMSIWLEEFLPDTDNFDWDMGNIGKNMKHGVSDEQIESLFRQNQYVFAGKIIEPEHDEWRGLILGQNDAGQLLALIFTQRGDKLRPISCRPMREGEKKFYESNIQHQK